MQGNLWSSTSISYLSADSMQWHACGIHNRLRLVHTNMRISSGTALHCTLKSLAAREVCAYSLQSFLAFLLMSRC